MHYFVSFLVLQSSCFIVLRMSCYCKCSVTLPHGTVGWSGCVIVVFPDYTHLLFEHAKIFILDHVKSFASFMN